MVKVEESWWGRRLDWPSGWYFTTKFITECPYGRRAETIVKETDEEGE